MLYLTNELLNLLEELGFYVSSINDSSFAAHIDNKSNNTYYLICSRGYCQLSVLIGVNSYLLIDNYKVKTEKELLRLLIGNQKFSQDFKNIVHFLKAYLDKSDEMNQDLK
ncbi:hypothetical protein R9C00_19315 [Flammeovirgaceae bacterium SG7u.111]|nr:hypothetical protein [Flammeovirgaceae bacterium SG7u.132]WPO33851.1 hypothetical protein R9C00_19315 [Flammeovirgaceae bacterium SG7u.111]